MRHWPYAASRFVTNFRAWPRKGPRLRNQRTFAYRQWSGTTLADGTELLVGHIALAADGPAFLSVG